MLEPMPHKGANTQTSIHREADTLDVELRSGKESSLMS